MKILAEIYEEYVLLEATDSDGGYRFCIADIPKCSIEITSAGGCSLGNYWVLSIRDGGRVTTACADLIQKGD